MNDDDNVENEETTESVFTPEVAQEIYDLVFNKPGFIKLTQSLRRGGKVFRISIRPVTIKGQRMHQAEMIDSGRTEVRNLTLTKAQQGLEQIINQRGARDLHILTTTIDLHMRVTKKHKVLLTRSQPQRKDAPINDHDRIKKQPLTSFDAAPLLKVIGISDSNDEIKPSMRGKYDQVNELLREIDILLPDAEKPITIIDCGCGKAYLTLATYVYLTQSRGFTVKIIGVDKNASVIESARKMTNSLSCYDDVSFQETMITDANLPQEPTLVMSLHACDTATDDALIAAINLKAEKILCVPCCQHELHNVLERGDAMRAVLRHGILRERLADLLTDTFRAQVLRIMGYKARVIEFVSSEATARNILIRAERGPRPGISEAVGEYVQLKDFWGVDPYIARTLGTSFSQHLD